MIISFLFAIMAAYFWVDGFSFVTGAKSAIHQILAFVSFTVASILSVGSALTYCGFKILERIDRIRPAIAPQVYSPSPHLSPISEPFVPHYPSGQNAVISEQSLHPLPPTIPTVSVPLEQSAGLAADPVIVTEIYTKPQKKTNPVEITIIILIILIIIIGAVIILRR